MTLHKTDGTTYPGLSILVNELAVEGEDESDD